MKKIVILVMVFALLLTSMVYGADKGFTDVQETDWFYEVLNNVVERGIIDGYPDGTFKPQDNITRAEFTKVIVTALELDIIEGDAFVDTEGHWAQDVINTAIENHIINRTEYGYSYAPDEKITRVEMAKMVVRALGFDEDAIGKVGEETKFVDNFAIMDVDKGYVVIASENGIVNGYTNNTFQPNGKATRAEACQMLVNMLNVIEGIEVEVPVDEDDIIDAGKLDLIPIEDTDYDYLKDYKDTDLRGNITYEVDGIVEADKSMFPIKFGNVVITGIDKVKAEDAPYYGDTSIGWRNSDNKDAVAIHAYAVNGNDDSSRDYFWVEGLEIVFVNNSGETFNKPIMKVAENADTIYEETVELYDDYAVGEYPKMELNKNFTVMFISKESFNYEDLDNIILLDTYDSIREGLKFNIDEID
ncbi:S-layer homology domain-containing protein [Sedimentibacter sp. MB31-C6]|uniref:S-layer homology domain-containing protein n=1 Tax=Sedimentibacter sp. MB31-C6 TaxID=3109366 RepID=UPI002DDD2932|nr:S-layer homology domain-containing protein [Sedimentibacter sp. MB36-C1]WSI05124.1 S-layer homology domain-containing protein [Sedimentibacter sp. MB36-C1]